MGPEESSARSRQLWRRQLALVLLAVVTVTVVHFARSTVVVRYPAIAVVLLSSVLGASVLHTVQVARFTFRRQED
jgi:uncharacterized integral membrane protein